MAKGLFHRAISQSGMPGSRTLEEASRLVDDGGAEGSSGEVLVAQLLLEGKAKDRAAAVQLAASMSPGEVASFLRARSSEQLLTPFKPAGGQFGMYRSPAILRDGHVVPQGLIVEALARSASVPVLLGTNRDEFKLFMLGDSRYVTRFLGLHLKDEAAFERDARLVSDLWRAVGSDAPAAALTAAGAPVFAYRFDWDEEPSSIFARLPKLLGAAHGLEIGFVMDDEAAEFDPFGIATEHNAPGRVPLSRAMMSYWVQFARTGDPGRGVDGTLPEWSSFAEGRVMLLDTPESGGPRMQQGVVTVDEVEQRVWSDPTLEPARRCEMIRLAFQGFAGQTGAWTPERAARYREKCPAK